LATFLEKGGDQARFRSDYQSWYTTARALVQLIGSDRLADFEELYRPKKVPSKLTISDYGIFFFLNGVTLTFDQDPGGTAGQRFVQQAHIVRSLRSRVDSVVERVRETLNAELLDTELAAARELLHAGHLRAAGAVAGVAVERHLHDLVLTHQILIAKKNPTIAEYNDRLRDASIYPQTTWRRISLLADIRNVCTHAKGREPTAEEVDTLVSGAAWLTKSVA
jgi:hypothetical protein